jgi:hypothetical protein
MVCRTTWLPLTGGVSRPVQGTGSAALSETWRQWVELRISEKIEYPPKAWLQLGKKIHPVEF